MLAVSEGSHMSAPRIEGGYEGTPSGVVSKGTTPVGEVVAENPERHFAAVDAVRHDTQRRILYTIAAVDEPATYQTIGEYTDRSDRTVRKHAQKLEAANLVERVGGKCATFNSADNVADVLIRHALTLYFDADAADV